MTADQLQPIEGANIVLELVK